MCCCKGGLEDLGEPTQGRQGSEGIRTQGLIYGMTCFLEDLPKGLTLGGWPEQSICLGGTRGEEFRGQL